MSKSNKVYNLSPLTMIVWGLLVGLPVAIGCIGNVNDPGSTLQAHAGNDEDIEEGDGALLAGFATGGTGPYTFRWTQNAGPTVSIGDPTERVTSTGNLTQRTRYVFRLMVTDSAGRTDEDFVAYNVIAPPPPDELTANIDGPALLQTLQQGTYDAEVTGNDGEVTYQWEIVSGDGELRDATSATALVTPSAGFEGTITLRLTVTEVESGNVDSDEIDITVEVGEFSVTVVGPEDPETGELFPIRADVRGALGEVDYDWELVGGSAGAGLGQANCPSVWGFVELAGEFSARVTVTDRETGEELGVATGDFDIPEAEEDAFAITIAPNLLLTEPDTPTTLDAVIEGDVSDVSYAWEIISGEGTIDDSTAESVVVTPEGLGTVHVRLSLTATGSDGEETLTKDAYVVTTDGSDPEAIIEFQDFGPVRVRLNSELAPIATANFLSYVDEQHYDGLIIHRSNPDDSEFAISRIDGGAFDETLTERTPHDPIPNEAGNGLEAIRGALIVALPLTSPDSGRAAFLISTKDNSESPIEGSPPPLFGQTVFGEVIEGMDVVDAINALETENRCGDFRFEFAFAPVDTVFITSIRRATTE